VCTDTLPSFQQNCLLAAGGVTRMTISITVLVMEITGGLQVSGSSRPFPSSIRQHPCHAHTVQHRP